DGTIHSPGLLGCHVGECPGDKLRRFGRLALARKPRSYTKPHQPALAGDGVHQNVGWLDILVDETSLVSLPSAAARQTPKRRNRLNSIGCPRNRSSASPPASSRTSIVRPSRRATVRGRAAQSELK